MAFFSIGPFSLVLILWIVSTAGQLVREGAKSGDFCLTESFQASCSEDEVILMDTALYGRMSLGRCVKTDFGFVGCSTEVLTLADTRCSGRRRCVIRVPDPLFEDTRPCNEEFKSYLQASYSCVRVVPAQARRCQMAQPLRIAGNEGYIANVVTEESGCGSDDTPWAIEVQPGQRINITLYDFSRVTANGPSDTGAVVSRGCIMYGHIRDDASKKRESICGGGDRVRHVYTSVSSRILVNIIKSYSPKGKRHFMLHYEAFGCADITPPRGSWVRRDGESILMGCKNDDDVFKLTCNGQNWQGKRPNCTTDEIGGTTSMLGVLSLPVGAAITLILAIAVGVSALILLAGLLVIRRRRALDKNGPRRQPNPSILLTDGTLRRVKSDPRASSNRSDSTSKTPYSRQSLGQSNLNDNEYAYVWETNQSNNAHQACQYCAETCNLSLNVHAVDCGHYGVPCTGMPSGGESLYEKSTYSSGGRHYNDRAHSHHQHEVPGPQYFELDPEVFPKGRDTLPASVPLGGDKGLSGKKYNASEGTLDRTRGGEIDEHNRINFMAQHVTS